MRRHFARLQQLRSELLHEASHDIRSGLTAISGISGVLAGKPDGDQREQLAGIINESVSSVVEILDSLMELNRLEAGKETVAAERFDLAAHLRSLGESFRQVAEGKGLELEIDGDREILISSDPGKLRRIVQNLLVNAIKYTKQGSVSLLWKRGMHHCEVRIIDTGPGLRAKHGLQVLEELADQNTPEATPDEEDAGVLSYEGEGIGLTIVKRLCSLLRIPIDLQSGAGRGTTFVLYIPNDLKPEIVPDEPDS